MPTIRNATPTDTALLATLIREAYQYVAEKFTLTPNNCPTHPSNCQPEWIEKSIDKGVEYFILENNSTPCGCVALEQAGPNVCYLERLAVLPQYQQKGYGETLVQHGFAEAVKRDTNRVEIAIIAQQTELKQWYEKLGFTETHTKTFDHLPFDVTFMFVDLTL